LLRFGRKVEILVDLDKIPEKRGVSLLQASFMTATYSRVQGQSHIVAQWADNHNELALGWVAGDPTHAQYVNDWAKTTYPWPGNMRELHILGRASTVLSDTP